MKYHVLFSLKNTEKSSAAVVIGTLRVKDNYGNYFRCPTIF